jgi:hypothetical protein
MIDSQSAVSAAVYSALNGNAAVGELAEVWQNPPEDTQPGDKGLVLVGLVSVSAEDPQDELLDRATFEVETYVRKPDARVLYALNFTVRSALSGQALAIDGALLSAAVFLSADPQLMEDGVTYADRLRFETFVQPA